jgi:glycosyltransferase involved in cell wall biosynthesis
MRSVSDSPRIVFYRTLAIDPASRFGSALRPARLLAAFRQLGYAVDVVAGPARERKPAAAAVMENLRRGIRYDFLYAEPPTTPIPLNESHHLPTQPLFDYRFLLRCHALGVPVVLFYSDVQWRLSGYRDQVGSGKYAVMLPFFHLDLLVFDRTADALLVPDSGMLRKVGRLARKPSWVSIPGFDPEETPPPRAPAPAGGPLRLFYVGGVEPPVYDLAPLLEGAVAAVRAGTRLELTICCREPEWRRRAAGYRRFLGRHVRIVHNKDRRELLDMYAGHDVAVMPYGTLNSDWAMPIKFPEAIGMGLPVLAGAGTAVGRVVEEQGIGWTVDRAAAELVATVRRIDEVELARARQALRDVQPRYTWTERAREIVTIVQGLKKESLQLQAGHR